MKKIQGGKVRCRVPGLIGIARRASFFVLFLLSVSPLLAETRVSGRVIDQRTGAPSPDLRIAVLESRQTATTNTDGVFEIALPAPGTYTFRIIMETGVVQLRREVRFSGEKLEFYLTADGSVQTTQTTSEGISVVGFADRTRLSRHRLTNDEIRRLPGVYGDSLKAITTLPGVSPAPTPGVLPSVNILSTAFLSSFGVGPPYKNSTAGILVLRGAGPRSSQFFLDGFRIQYPFHLGDQSSVLNNDFIRNIDVYTGTYPVRFGNSTGGVISIEGPTEVKRRAAHINVALFLSDAYVETPFINENGYFVATARQSYPNYTLLHLYPDAVPPNAKYAVYADGQFKLGYRFNQNHEVTMIYFGAHDTIQYTKSVAESANKTYSGGSAIPGIDISTNLNDTNSDSRPPVGTNKGFHTQGVKYLYKRGGVLQNTVYAQLSEYREDFELDFRSPLTGETIFGYQILNARHEIQYRDEFLLELVKNHVILGAGLESNHNRWELSMKNFSPSKSINPNTPSFIDTVNQLVDSNRTFRALYDGDRTKYILNAAYADLDIDIWRFRFTPGIRGESYSLSNSTGIGPRMGVEFNIPETRTSFLAGAGRHFAVPPAQEQISLEAANPNLKMEQSDHVAGGIHQEIGRNWQIKAEGYRNIFTNLVVEDRFEYATFSLRTNRRDLVEKINDIRVNPYESRNINYSSDGTGWSRGVEFFIKKTRAPGARGFFGWLSYTYSETKRNNHQTRLTQKENDALNARNLNRKVLAQGNIGRTKLLYFNTGELEAYFDNDREELYDLDRTHIASLVLNYKFNSSWQIGSRWRYATAPPYTPISSANNTGAFTGILTFIPKYSEFYNSARYLPFHQLDIRIDYFMNYEWGHANMYIEFINFYARRNAESENFNFLSPYNRANNPTINYQSTYIATPAGGGRQLLLPLVNIGMELKF